MNTALAQLQAQHDKDLAQLKGTHAGQLAQLQLQYAGNDLLNAQGNQQQSINGIGNFLYGRTAQALFLLVVFVISGGALLYVGQRLWSDTGETVT